MSKVPAVGNDDEDVGGGACADAFDAALTTLTSMGYDPEELAVRMRDAEQELLVKKPTYEEVVCWVVASVSVGGTAKEEERSAGYQAAEEVTRKHDKVDRQRKLDQRYAERKARGRRGHGAAIGAAIEEGQRARAQEGADDPRFVPSVGDTLSVQFGATGDCLQWCEGVVVDQAQMPAGATLMDGSTARPDTGKRKFGSNDFVVYFDIDLEYWRMDAVKNGTQFQIQSTVKAINTTLSDKANKKAAWIQQLKKDNAAAAAAEAAASAVALAAAAAAAVETETECWT